MEGSVEVGALLQTVTALLITIVGGLVTWALKRIISVDKKMSSTEVWAEDHEKSDDERHRENLGKFNALFEALNKRR